ncbi:hypoxanthine phosphoribosyltransferase [Halanaerobium hydrogeniformans]|uniref:Hypoxanthine phosphoribosyltransferase n=1 Tax=Halanaerobium hydrogeniformans TaxID=656519 RepID=E4RIQ0_HALHG|nr:hypoxanthine phosphoribosyltransferase [Halanaerobium hydrogeniformans]ADQ15120.1 hypoxanthine phosphoribosyltransferase [Halanaerobium hydrogeniformans]
METDKNLGKIIISEKEISEKVEELATQINKDYKDKEIIIVSILKSSLYFMTDLTQMLEIPLKLDFLEISHYSDEDDSGIIRVTRDLEFSIANKEVLIIENIIRTGLTQSYLLRNLKSRNPKSLNICTFLNNTEKKLVELPVHYSGFEVKDEYLVGYGLDYKEKYRNLPYIAEYNFN